MILKLTRELEKTWDELAHRKARAEYFQTNKDQQQQQCFSYEAELFELRMCLEAATDRIEKAEMKVTRVQRYIKEKEQEEKRWATERKTRTEVRNLLMFACLPWQSLKHLPPK